MKISGFYFLKNTARIGACTAVGVLMATEQFVGKKHKLEFLTMDMGQRMIVQMTI